MEYSKGMRLLFDEANVTRAGEHDVDRCLFDLVVRARFTRFVLRCQAPLLLGLFRVHTVPPNGVESEGLEG